MWTVVQLFARQLHLWSNVPRSLDGVSQPEWQAMVTMFLVLDRRALPGPRTTPLVPKNFC
jgi:hypothetical protein